MEQEGMEETIQEAIAAKYGPELERAGVDNSVTAVAVGAGEGQRSRALFDQ